MIVNDRTLIDVITKCLYPGVVAKHNTTSNRVDRVIRHAIDTAWGDEMVVVMYNMFRYNDNMKPKNSEFIALIVDKIILEMK